MEQTEQNASYSSPTQRAICRGETLLKPHKTKGEKTLKGERLTRPSIPCVPLHFPQGDLAAEHLVLSLNRTQKASFLLYLLKAR